MARECVCGQRPGTVEVRDRIRMQTRPREHAARIFRVRDGARKQPRLLTPRAARVRRPLEQLDTESDVLQAVDHAQEGRDRGDLGRVELDRRALRVERSDPPAGR